LLPADGAYGDIGDLARLAAARSTPGTPGLLRQHRPAGADLRDRRRDQGSTALDRDSGPVERAAVGVRETEPRRHLGLAAGAEPRRAPGAGLLPLHPAGRSHAGA